MYLSLWGNVDSGKTTFINYFSKNKIEKYGRTEQLSLITGQIGSLKTSFFDLPGHVALRNTRGLALELSDAVIYLIDYNNPNLEDLNTLLELKKEVLVLVNKWPKTSKSLKDICKDQKEKTKLYLDLLKFSNLGDFELKPFLDTTSQLDIYLFPLNIHTGFGVKEFEAYFSHLWAKFIPEKRKSYLYSVELNKYKQLGLKPENTLHLKGKKYLLSDVFDYNLVNQTYSLKSNFSEFESLLYDLLDPENALKQPVVIFSKIEINPELKSFLKNKLKQKCYVYTQNYYKQKTLLETLKTFNFEPELVTNMSKQQFYEIEPNCLKIIWSHEGFTDSKKNIIGSDTYYTLLIELEAYLKTKNQQYETQSLKKLRSNSIGQLLPEYIFKNSKDVLVCGTKLEYGTFKVNQEMLIVGQSRKIKAKIIEMQENNKKQYTWDDKKINIAIKYELSEPWTPDLGLIKIYNLNLLTNLELWSNQENKKIIEELKVIKENLKF